MAIKTREELKTWFLPAYKLIQNRLIAWFDSYIHKSDDIYCVDLTSSDQAGDFSVTKAHNLDATNLLVVVEDSEGKPVYGMDYQNIYVDGLCNSTKIFYSDAISGTEKLNILKLK